MVVRAANNRPQIKEERGGLKMFGLIYVLAVLSALCLVFGVVYPLVAVLLYPVYRRLGGRLSLREYIRSL
jgi:hypothetical protein